MAPAVATDPPRAPRHTMLDTVIAEPLEPVLPSRAEDPDATGRPADVQRAWYDSLRCGLLAHGLLRRGCETCHQELLVPCGCKRRGFCPSCAGRRMAQTAAHLVAQVSPWVPTRQWVVSVPIPLRSCMAGAQDLTATVQTMPRHQGIDGEATQAGTPYWHWARFLGRVFALARATCPWCRRGTLRIMAVITQESVLTRILRHLQLASVPPPIAPAWSRQEICAFASAHAPWRRPVSAVRAAEVSLLPLRPCHPGAILLPLPATTGRAKAHAPGEPWRLPLTSPQQHVQATHCRAAPRCALLRQAAAGREGRGQHRARGAAAGACVSGGTGRKCLCFSYTPSRKWSN